MRYEFCETTLNVIHIPAKLKNLILSINLANINMVIFTRIWKWNMLLSRAKTCFLIWLYSICFFLVRSRLVSYFFLVEYDLFLHFLAMWHMFLLNHTTYTIMTVLFSMILRSKPGRQEVSLRFSQNYSVYDQLPIQLLEISKTVSMIKWYPLSNFQWHNITLILYRNLTLLNWCVPWLCMNK